MRTPLKSTITTPGLRRLALALLLAAGLALGTGRAAPQPARADIPGDALTVAAAFISVPTPLTAGVAAATSAYNIAAWLNGSGDTIEARFTNQQTTLTVDVGFTYEVEFEVKYSFADNIFSEGLGGRAENVFVEVYLVANDQQVVYYKRIPEQGYFTNPDAWFDDSQAGQFDGQMQFGATTYDPGAAPTALKLMAVMYNDHYPGRHDAPPYGGNYGLGQSHHFIPGRGLTPPGSFELLGRNDREARKARAVHGQLGLHAPIAEDTITFTVENPFSIEDVRSDHGVEKAHGETFVYEFRANMGYRSNFPGVEAFPPSPPRADVEMTGFASSDTWRWQGKPAPFEFPINSGAQSADSRVFSITGVHTANPHLDLATYETPYSLVATGRNRVTYEQPRAQGRSAPHEYTWSTPFKRAPNVNEVLPATFTVHDRSSGIAPPPTPTATPTETALDPRDGSAGTEVAVLVLDGQRFPLSQFRVAAPDACAAQHYHAEFAVSLEGTRITDPNPGECGFGIVGQVSVQTVTVTQADLDAYREAGGPNLE